jgi:hypothetical protein
MTTVPEEQIKPAACWKYYGRMCVGKEDYTWYLWRAHQNQEQRNELSRGAFARCGEKRNFCVFYKYPVADAESWPRSENSPMHRIEIAEKNTCGFFDT